MEQFYHDCHSIPRVELSQASLRCNDDPCQHKESETAEAVSLGYDMTSGRTGTAGDVRTTMRQ
jgi:hypothetical protein